MSMGQTPAVGPPGRSPSVDDTPLAWQTTGCADSARPTCKADGDHGQAFAADAVSAHQLGHTRDITGIQLRDPEAIPAE